MLSSRQQTSDHVEFIRSMALMPESCACLGKAFISLSHNARGLKRQAVVIPEVAVRSFILVFSCETGFAGCR